MIIQSSLTFKLSDSVGLRSLLDENDGVTLVLYAGSLKGGGKNWSLQYLAKNICIDCIRVNIPATLRS